MAASEDRKDRHRLGLMALAAVLAHGLLLLIVIPTRQASEPASIALNWLDLTQPEPSPQPAPESPSPEPDPPATEEPADLPPEAPLETEAESTPDAEEAIETPDPGEIRPEAQRLRELALIAGRASVQPAAPAEPGIQGRAAPRLPSQAGWLNDYVGTVTPRAERWVEADGSSAARVVTSSGQVYCGHARAPTMAEEFNPWMSAVVMTWRGCGRERPEPIDRTNPWVRGQGPRRD